MQFNVGRVVGVESIYFSGAIFCIAKNRAFRNSPSTAAHPLPNGRDSFAASPIPYPKSTLYKQAKPQKRVDFAQNYSQKRVFITEYIDICYILHTADLKVDKDLIFLPVYMTGLL